MGVACSKRPQVEFKPESLTQWTSASVHAVHELTSEPNKPQNIAVTACPQWRGWRCMMLCLITISRVIITVMVFFMTIAVSVHDSLQVISFRQRYNKHLSTALLQNWTLSSSAQQSSLLASDSIFYLHLLTMCHHHTLHVCTEDGGCVLEACTHKREKWKTGAL